MLSYALAIAVAISSLVLFSTAFLMSDIHRQDDFLWSGVGLIYALVLWFCARNITGAVLLGQASASILLVSYSWQTLKLRKALANPDRAAEISSFSLLQKVNGFLSRQKSQPKVAKTTPVANTNPKVTESKISIPDTPSQENQVEDQEIAPQTASPQTASPKLDSSKVENNLPSDKPEETVSDTQSESPKSSLKGTVISPTATPTNIQPATQAAETQATNTPTANLQSSASNQTSTTDTSNPVELETPETSETLVQDSAAETLPNQSQPTPIVKSEVSKEISNSVPDVSVVPDENKSELVVETTNNNNIEEEQPQNLQTKDTLNSLETVEIAEILDAVPEDISNKNNEDKNSIIEVTTTEIDAIAKENSTESSSD